MYTLGINWKWHDSAAALLDPDGEVVFFAEEERFCRQKHAWGSFPRMAARAALAAGRITINDVGVVAVGWDAPTIYRRVGGWPYESDRDVIVDVLGLEIGGRWRTPAIEFVGHHRSHAWSAFGASPYRDAAVLVVDGHGEHESISLWHARDDAMELRRTWPRSCSLGYLYEAASRYLGFDGLDGGKTMGLSAYGRLQDFEPLITPDTDLRSAIELAPDIGYGAALAEWTRYFAATFGAVRAPRESLDKDAVATAIASAVQRTVEAVLPYLVDAARTSTGCEAVCLAGGVALNCVANGQLDEPVFVPPFPHDAGVAVGAAWHVHGPPKRTTPLTPFLGKQALLSEVHGAISELQTRPWDPGDVAQRLVRGDIGAVASGRAEVGPRALGARSLVCLPRPDTRQDELNVRKGREPWRPFAPVARQSDADRLWLPSQGYRSRYMVGSAHVTPLGAAVLPAAVHVDGSTRPQEVTSGSGPFSAILDELGDGPVALLNTSLNGPGEPIANSAVDALALFHRMALDFIVIEDTIIDRLS